METIELNIKGKVITFPFCKNNWRFHHKVVNIIYVYQATSNYLFQKLSNPIVDPHCKWLPLSERSENQVFPSSFFVPVVIFFIIFFTFFPPEKKKLNIIMNQYNIIWMCSLLLGGSFTMPSII